MLRRIISCLLLGVFCCTLSACAGKTSKAPEVKDPSKNPVEQAKGTGNSPVKPEAIE